MSLSKEVPQYQSSDDEHDEGSPISTKKRREKNKFTDLREGRFNTHDQAKDFLTSLGYSFYYSDSADMTTGRLVGV